ncbi:MAG: hypothetical protein JO085_07805 [Acidimicrobiia bacterium]|nr:hypothetical protein [Acidimicrobiia bacterium]
MNLAAETGAEAGGVALGVQRMAPMEVLVGSEAFPVVIARAVGGFSLVWSLIALVGVLFPEPRIPDLHKTPIALLLCLGVTVGGMMVVRPRWFPPWFIRFEVLVGAVGTVVIVGLSGPRVEVGVAVIAAVGALAPLWLDRRSCVLFIGILATGYAVIVAAGSGYPGAVNRAIVVIGITITASAFFAWVVALLRNLATQERATHRELVATHAQLQEAHGQLADLNQHVEARVATQVAEIEALNRLRRFLSTPVADAVLSSDSDALLEPHRREIAVFFCDLRGFTKFAASAQPEEVHAVLTAYFDLLGEMVDRYQATVGGFTGDGLMAFFNDPLPVEEPALRAVAMAVELRVPMGQLIAGWQRQGYDLGFGVGIAFGFANIGTIGFEGRRDYTALGSVVNLAARLCAEATSGEILIDQRTSAACDGRVEVGNERSLALKGYHEPVPARSVTAVIVNGEHNRTQTERA